MDPVTSAIIAAITAGTLSGLTEASQKIISDAYNGIKKMLRKKFGGKSELIQAVKTLEKKPESEGRKEYLKEEIKSLGIDKDAEILELAQKILDIISNNSDSLHTQEATGNFIAQANRNSTATVNVNNSKGRDVQK